MLNVRRGIEYCSTNIKETNAYALLLYWCTKRLKRIWYTFLHKQSNTKSLVNNDNKNRM